MRESEKKTDDEKCHAMENANQPTCPPLPGPFVAHKSTYRRAASVASRGRPATLRHVFTVRARALTRARYRRAR